MAALLLLLLLLLVWLLEVLAPPGPRRGAMPGDAVPPTVLPTLLWAAAAPFAESDPLLPPDAASEPLPDVGMALALIKPPLSRCPPAAPPPRKPAAIGLMWLLVLLWLPALGPASEVDLSRGWGEAKVAEDGCLGEAAADADAAAAA